MPNQRNYGQEENNHQRQVSFIYEICMIVYYQKKSINITTFLKINIFYTFEIKS